MSKNWDQLTPEERLVRAKTTLILYQPFFANLLLSMEFVKVKEDDTGHNPYKTMAVDGEHIFWNENFVNSLSREELAGILVHECMHPALLHLSRMKPIHERERANIAMDYSINWQIRDMEKITLPEHCLYDPSYSNMAWENIYKKLPDDAKYPENALKDGHLEMTDGQQKEWIDKIIQTYNALSEAEKQRGTIPADIVRIINEFSNPKVDWRKFIPAEVQDIFLKTDYDYSMPSYHLNQVPGCEDIFFPRISGKKNKLLCVVCDTSGSISQEDIKVFCQEMNGVLQLADEIIVISCDAEVHELERVQHFEDVMQKIRLKGGGGTDFRPPFEALEKRHLIPELMIFMTDGYADLDCLKKPKYPVIFARTKNAVEESAFPAWSKVVTLEYE